MYMHWLFLDSPPRAQAIQTLITVRYGQLLLAVPEFFMSTPWSAHNSVWIYQCCI